jgi:DNA-binding NarL/FixJ family response regulator
MTSERSALRVLIADDHPLFRDGLQSLLIARGIEVVAEAANGREALELAWKHRPDVVLMDLMMPAMDGLEATRLLSAQLPDIKVVMLTVVDDDAKLFEAIKSGARGYLLKNLESDRFFELLEGVAHGEPALTPSLARKLLEEFARPTERRREPEDPDALTEREREVLELMVDGVTSNRRLASRLGVSENTVKFHVRNILDKLHLHNRAQVVAFALRHKLVVPSESDS